MPDNIRTIADSFDRRAESYARSNWHKRYAARLVELCALRPGDRVLDAGTGTGFAALAAARVVGANGHVCGVDISGGMLRQARRVLEQGGFVVVDVVSETIEFTPEDLSAAWESNFRSAAHSDVQRLGREEQRALQSAFTSALERDEREHPGLLNRADVLYAFGRR